MLDGLIIISLLILVGYLYFKYFVQTKSNNNKLDSNDIHSILIRKNKVKAVLMEMRDEHLKDLVNYEICLLYRTELDNQEIKEKLIQLYPKTLSKKPFNFSSVFNEFDGELVNICIIEILESLDAENFVSDKNEPFLRFEHYIRKQAKEKARRLFDDFVEQN